MAAQTNHSNDGHSCEIKDTCGVSYAGAVLNLKNNDNNKENINSSGPAPEAWDKCSKKQQANSNVHANSQPVLVVGKTKKNEEFPEINAKPTRSKHNDRERRQIRENAEVIHGNSNDKSKTSAKTKSNETNKSENQPVVTEKVKYVEAPLPTVNPWTSKRNLSTIPVGLSSEVVPDASEKESDKRVLQQQKQGSTGRCLSYM